MSTAIFSLFFFSAGLGNLGMPPGEIDPAFRKIAPEGTVLYMEWAEMKFDADATEGVDGFYADPEIVHFFNSTKKAILDGIRSETDELSEEKIFGEHIPALVLELVTRSGTAYGTVDEKLLMRILQNGPENLSEEEAFLALRGVVIINGGDRADAIASHLQPLVDLIPAEGLGGEKQDEDRIPALPANDLPEAKTEEGFSVNKQPDPEPKPSGLNRREIPLGLPPGSPRMFVHREGDYFILTFGTDNLEATIERVKNRNGELANSLGSNPNFTEAIEAVALERTSSHVFVDLTAVKATLANAFGEPMVEAMAKTLGLDELTSYTVSTGVVDGQVVNRTRLDTGGGTDRALAVFAGQPLTPDNFAHVPADSDFLYGFSLDLKKTLAAVKTIVGDADPESLEVLEGDLKVIEEETGLDIDNITEALGDAWVLHNAIGEGGLLLSNVVLTIEVADKQQAGVVFGQLMGLLKAYVPGDQESDWRRKGVYLEQRPFLDHTVWFVNFVGDDMPFTPSFCLTDEHIVLTLHPQAMKAHLREVVKPSKSVAETLAEKFGEGDTLVYGKVKIDVVVKSLWSIFPYISSVMYGSIQGELDREEAGTLTSFDFPSIKAILPYSNDWETRVVRTDDGIEIHTDHALPISGADKMIISWAGMMTYFIFAFGRF